MSIPFSDREQGPKNGLPYWTTFVRHYAAIHVSIAECLGIHDLWMRCHLIAEEILRIYVIFGLIIIWTGKADFLELQSSALSSRREQHINKEQYRHGGENHRNRVIKNHQRPKYYPKENFYLVNNIGQGHLVLEPVRNRVAFTLITRRSCPQNHASITREPCYYRSFRGHLIALGCAHISPTPRQPGEST